MFKRLRHLVLGTPKKEQVTEPIRQQPVQQPVQQSRPVSPSPPLDHGATQDQPQLARWRVNGPKHGRISARLFSWSN